MTDKTYLSFSTAITLVYMVIIVFFINLFHVIGIVHCYRLESLAIIRILNTSLHMFFLQFNVSRPSQSSDW